MKRIIDTSEALGEVDTTEGRRELFAAADASYDETAGCLVVKLEACLRNNNSGTKEKSSTGSWLPQPETVRESVGPEEAMELARDIFHRWVRKVREAAPLLHHV